MSDKRIHSVSIHCAVEFETHLEPTEYPISDGGLMGELNRAVRHVLGEYYSKGKISKPEMIVQFDTDKPDGTV